MIEWVECILGDVLELQRGFDLPSQDRSDGEFPIIASNGVTGFHKEFKVKPPGVVIGRSGSIGGGQYIERKFWPLNTTLWVKDFKNNDPRFCYYLLKSIDLKQFNVGSGVPTLNRNHIHPYPVKIPKDVSIQRKISDFAGAFDDKIALIDKTNETLEAIVKNIFKDWFVEFGPSKLKAIGRKPASMNEETASLFPDSFQDSELGKIPKGWSVATVEEVSRRIAMGPFGSNIKTDNFVKSGVPIIRGSNLSKGFVEEGFVFLTDDKADELKKSAAFPLDLIFTHRGTIGQIEMIPKTSRFKKYIVSQSQLVLSPNESKVSAYYLNEFFHSHLGFDQWMSYSSTTGVPAIGQPTTNLKKIKLVLPPISVMSKFDQYAEMFLTKRDWNNLESKQLEQARDLILPKLISGEIELKD